MTCLLIIQALPCITTKRKQQRDKPDHVRVCFAQPRSRYLTSNLVESIWCSSFSNPWTRTGGHPIARIQTSLKGQPTTLPVLSSPCLALQSVLAMEVTAATEYRIPQTSVQPKEQSLSSLNLQTCGTKHSPQLPSASYLSNLSTIFSLGHPKDQRQEPTYSSRERRLSIGSSRDDGEYPEKGKVPRSLQPVLESRSNSGSLAMLSANSLSSDLVNPITMSSPAPHQLALTPGMWVLVAGESQSSHRPPNFCSCLQGKSPKPGSSLKDLTVQNGEASVTTFNPSVTIASVDQPKTSTGGYSAVSRSTIRTSDQNRPRPKGAEGDGPFTIPHLVNASHFGSPGVNINKDHSTEQMPSLIPIPTHCQSPASTSSASKLHCKSEPAFAAATPMRPSKCDEFVEIPLDEIFPPNPKAVPERKAWLGISEPLSELWAKILPSSIFNCFHVPAGEKLRAPAGKNLTTDSSNTLSVRVPSEAPGSGTGLDAGHAWGKLLNVSRSGHVPLPWGETFADLLFQEIFKPTEILKSDHPISSRGTERVRQNEFQLMTCKDQDHTKSPVPISTEVFASVPCQPNRAEQFIQNSHRESSWAGGQSGSK